MDSLFSSSTSLFFGRSAAAHEAPTVDETPAMPPAFDEPDAPVASNGAAASTVVRIGADNDTHDDDADFASSLIVSDLLSDAVKLKTKTPTPVPSVGDKTDEADATTARKRDLKRASVPPTPSVKSTARTPRTAKRQATEEPAGIETPTTTKRGRATKSASAEKDTATLPTATNDNATGIALAEPVEEELSGDDDDIPAILPLATKATPGKKRGRPSMGKTKSTATTPAKPSVTASGARRGRPPGKSAPKPAAPIKDRPLTGRQAALQAYRIANPLPVPAAPKVKEPAPKKKGRPAKAATATVTGTKRGRPSKADAAAAGTDAPKKRGRPSKADAAAAVGSADAPKKRGRPSKADAAAATASPKKKGRPSKADTAAEAGTDAPKKRGRPSKADAAAASPKKRGRPAGSASTTATTVSPKKRGRPAGSAAATATPKKRGRPPASATATPAATPGKRGRPPGSTAKPKPAKKSEFVVESIVEHRTNPITAAVEYCIKWQGYDSSDNTWEPKRNLKGCDEILAAYEKKQE